MLEDMLLIWKFNRGDRQCLAPIYEKYKHDLVTLAAVLLTDVSTAEDVVHDVFVSFIRSAGDFRLTGSLRGYLATCVANNARNKNRMLQRHKGTDIEQIDEPSPDSASPDTNLITDEQQRCLIWAIGQIPYEQREVLVLRVYEGMRFRTIARQQGVSINTVQGRYRYALDRLRSLLNGKLI